MTNGIREIADLLLVTIQEMHKINPLEQIVKVSDIRSKSEFAEYLDDINDALSILDNAGHINANKTNDGNYYEVQITTEGKLHLEDTQKVKNLVKKHIESSELIDQNDKTKQNVLLGKWIKPDNIFDKLMLGYTNDIAYAGYNYLHRDFDELMSFCNENDEIYLQYLFLEKFKKDYENTPLEYRHLIADHEFMTKVEREINYLEKEIKLKPPVKNADNKFTEDLSSKIRWKGTETQIVYLFDELINNGFLGQETNNEKYKLISEHFLNKKGKNFKPKQLSVTFQNLTGKKPNKSAKIDEIINKTKTK